MNAVIHVPSRPAAFAAALEGLTRLNETLLSDAALRGGSLPPLYESGVRYRREPQEVWRHVEDVYSEGWGDCEDLAAWRAAELRVSGEDPEASVMTYKSAPHTYHAVVLRGDDSIEDPSRALGMKSRRRGPMHMNDIPISRQVGLCGFLPDDLSGDGEADAAMINDPTPDNPYVTHDAEQVPGGFRAAARIPLATGRAILTASSVKPTPEAASTAALKLASRALDSKAAQMLLPPQARLALQLMKSPQARAIAKSLFKVGKKFWRR